MIVRDKRGREEQRDEQGRVKAKAVLDFYYPELETWVVATAYYYDKEYGDAYSLQILETKHDVDLSAKFFDQVKETYDVYRAEFRLDEFDVIAVIPTSKPHLPFNPTLVQLARKLSSYTNISNEQVIERMEFKTSETRRVGSRYGATKGTMKVRGDVKGKKVLLMDDIKTSGVSILECTKILKEAGAEDVVALCLGIHGRQVI